MGGSHITIVLLNDVESVIIDKIVRKIVDRSTTTVLSLISDCCLEMILKHPNVVSIGIAIPGNVDPLSGNTRYLPNFGWLEPIPLRSIIHNKLQSTIPLCIRNDGRCAALAEQKLGVGKVSKVFAMLTLGTGFIPWRLQCYQ